MLHMLSGLLLLLDLAFIWALAKNDTTNFSNMSHVPGGNSRGNINDSTIYEENEDFQDQDRTNHYSKCNEMFLSAAIEIYCLSEFNNTMEDLGKAKWCYWEEVLSHYSDLTHCMENCAKYASCYYPNAVVQEMFVKVHKQYFTWCPTKEEDVLPEAPASVVLMLTLLPVSAIPVLVYMVIKKSSVID